MADNDHQDKSAADVPEPHKLLGVLADTAKLRVFAALVLAPREGLSAAQAAETAGVGAADAAKALANLTGIGLARQVGGAAAPAGPDWAHNADGADGAVGAEPRYAAFPGVLRESLSELGRRREQRAAEQFATDDPASLSVLLACFEEDGRLGYLPEKFEKRRIVLEEIAQRFEPGTRYAEAEVNMVLRELYPDFAALRRYLVDSVLLTRAEGHYWRTGGTVPV